MAAQSKIPKGWRAPTSSELTYQADPWRDTSPTKYLVVRADFDGDKKVDEAKLLVQTDGKKFALFVFLASGSTIRLDHDEVALLQVMGIDLLPPDAYRTACGKGYWKCEKDEPETLQLRVPGIMYFKSESAASVFFWSPSEKKLRQVWLSD